MHTETTWTTVARKRGRNARSAGASQAARKPASKTPALAPPGDAGPNDAPPSEAAVARLVEQVRAAIDGVQQTAFAASLLRTVDAMEPPDGAGRWREVVAYGVGAISSSAKARAQLAMAELLRAHLSVPAVEPKVASPGGDALRVAAEDSPGGDDGAVCDTAGDAWYFDPVTTADEREALRRLGWRLISCNEEAKRAAAGPVAHTGAHPRSDSGGVDKVAGATAVSVGAFASGTVFFMPHCPFRLYSNVLWANWGAAAAAAAVAETPEGTPAGGTLARCAVVGNSFGAYDARTMDARARACASNCVLRLLPFTAEEDLQSYPQAVAAEPPADGAAASEAASAEASAWASAEGSPDAQRLSLTKQRARDGEVLGRLAGCGLEAFGDLALMHWPPSALAAADAAGAWEPRPPEEFGVSHG